VGFFFCEELGGRNVEGTSNQGFKDNKFLGWMVVGTSIKVSISVGLLSVNLVGKGAIRKSRNKDIQKGEGVVLLGFHSELDVRGKVVKVVKKGDKVGVAMRPNNKSVIYKPKPTFGFEMEVV
jgi:hypothetical protein